jgi:hypothetical protein
MKAKKKKALKKAKKLISRVTGPWEGHETEHKLFKILKKLSKAI